jgi:hypothetical protein
MRKKINHPLVLLVIIIATVVLSIMGCSTNPTMAVTYVPLKTATNSEELTSSNTASVITPISEQLDITLTPSSTTTSTSTRTGTAAPSQFLLLTNTIIITIESSPTFTPSPYSTNTSTQEKVVEINPTLTPNTITQQGSGTSNEIMIYLTHLGTGGPIGCGDSLVAIRTGYQRTGSIEKDVQIAVDTLFSIGQYSLSLYNATYPSTLRFSGLQLIKREATVDLAGQYVKPADACDASRYREQVWKTIEQFPEIDKAVPKFKGALLGDLLSIFSDGKK